MKRRVLLSILVIAVVAMVGTVVLLAVTRSSAEEKKPWESINWDEPKTAAERILADEWIPPKGWEEAVKGVDKLVITNCGGMKGDIATLTNFKIFTKKTGIPIEYVVYYETDDQNMVYLASKDPNIHIIQISRNATSFTHFAAANWLQKVNEIWTPSIRKLYFPEELKGIMYGEDFYGEPGVGFPFLIYYRPSWLERAGVVVPSNYEELYEAADKMREWCKTNIGEDVYGFSFGMQSGTVWMDDAMRILLSPIGERFHNSDTEKFRLDTPGFKAAWDWYLGMIKEDIAPKANITQTHIQAAQLFGMGKAAFSMGMASFGPRFDVDFPAVKGDWVAVAPFTSFDGVSGPYVRGSYYDYDGYYINAAIDDKHKAAAMLFLDFHRSIEAMANEVLVEGNESPLVATYEYPNLPEVIHWDIVEEAAKELGRSVPPKYTDIPYKDVRLATAKAAVMESYLPGAARAMMTISEYWTKAALGELSSEEALAEAQKKIVIYGF